jgi:hypothetical protein
MFHFSDTSLPDEKRFEGGFAHSHGPHHLTNKEPSEIPEEPDDPEIEPDFPPEPIPDFNPEIMPEPAPEILPDLDAPEFEPFPEF